MLKNGQPALDHAKKGKMSSKEEYYFFLMDYSHIDVSIPLSLLNPTQGKIEIKDSIITNWDEAYNNELSEEFIDLKENKIQKEKFDKYLEKLEKKAIK